MLEKRFKEGDGLYRTPPILYINKKNVKLTQTIQISVLFLEYCTNIIAYEIEILSLYTDSRFYAAFINMYHVWI